MAHRGHTANQHTTMAGVTMQMHPWAGVVTSEAGMRGMPAGLPPMPAQAHGRYQMRSSRCIASAASSAWNALCCSLQTS